jgi:nucleoside-diphosphate-sugar epimerase
VRVLVTGATGFVAGHLIPRLVADGHHVIAAGHDPARLPPGGDQYFRAAALTRRPQAGPRLSHRERELGGARSGAAGHALPREGGVEPLVVDLGDPSFVAALPAGVDAIAHLVQSNVPFPEGAGALFAVNVASTQRLLEYARRAGARRFVFTSSGSVYGPGERPWRESDPRVGPGYSAATKLAAERLVAAYAGEFEHSVFRLFTPYGPGQQVRRLVPGIIDRVRSGRAVSTRPDGGPRFTPLYVAHAVEVLAQSLAAEGSHLLNLAGDEVVSIRQIAETAGELVGREPIYTEDGTGGDTLGDATQLRAHYRLPEPLVTLRDGIRRMRPSPAGAPLGPRSPSPVGEGARG